LGNSKSLIVPRLAVRLMIARIGARRSPPISASVAFCLRSRVFELFLRPLLISLRRALGCRTQVAFGPGFIGGILLALATYETAARCLLTWFGYKKSKWIGK
jgi:hypothetical protein